MTDLKQAMLQAAVMLKVGAPAYNTDDVLEVLEAALALPQFEAVTPQPQPNVLPDHEEYGAGMYFRTTQQPLTLDQVSMIWSRVYPAQPLSQNVLNLVREVEAAHGIGGET